jgi:hypothetical protein
LLPWVVLPQEDQREFLTLGMAAQIRMNYHNVLG